VKNYNVYLIENTQDARWNIPEFLKSQKEYFTCKSCGGIINQHKKACSECGKEANLLSTVLDKIKEHKPLILLKSDDYKDRKNLIKKFEAAYGNEHIFRYAMLKFLEKHENMAKAFGLYFGFQDAPKNVPEIANILNLSTARVSKLCNQAFRRLIMPKFYKEVWDEYGYKEKEKKKEI
jgi:negative regulator of replication initiation